jgi:hypothetical protein
MDREVDIDENGDLGEDLPKFAIICELNRQYLSQRRHSKYWPEIYIPNWPRQRRNRNLGNINTTATSATNSSSSPNLGVDHRLPADSWPPMIGRYEIVDTEGEGRRS